MVLTLISLGILVLGIIGWIVYEHSYYSDNIFTWYSGAFTVICFTIGVISSLLCGILVLSVAISNMTLETSKQIERENYIAVLESGVYDDAFNISDINTIKDVQNFNKDIAINKLYLENPWTNWFVESGWNNLEEIDLDKYINKTMEEN